MYRNSIETPLGELTYLWDDGVLYRVIFGSHDSQASLKRWDELEGKFVRYFEGDAVSFKEIEVNLDHLSEFQRRVVSVVRNIPYGETLTYGEVSEKALSPKAFRAVGNVVGANRVPIVIPCHRVLAKNGLGGFSLPGGTKSKRYLLDLESSKL